MIITMVKLRSWGEERTHQERRSSTSGSHGTYPIQNYTNFTWDLIGNRENQQKQKMKTTRGWRWSDGEEVLGWCYQGFSCWGLWGFQREGGWCRKSWKTKTTCLTAPHSWNWALPLPSCRHRCCCCSCMWSYKPLPLSSEPRFHLRPVGSGAGPHRPERKRVRTLGARHCCYWSAKPLESPRATTTTATQKVSLSKIQSLGWTGRCKDDRSMVQILTKLRDVSAKITPFFFWVFFVGFVFSFTY